MLRPFVIALIAAGLATPSRAEPVATDCFCGPDKSGLISTRPAADAPTSCLLVSQPDGSACQRLVDLPAGAVEAETLFLALFPRAAGLAEDPALLSRSRASWLIDRGMIDVEDSGAEAVRRRDRTDGIAGLLATRASGLLGEEGRDVAEAFRKAVTAQPGRVDDCRARALYAFFDHEGPLVLDLPPYAMQMEGGFGCYHAQFGGYVTFAVDVEGTLYRYMIAMRRPR